MKKNKFTAIFKSKHSLAWSIVTAFLVIFLIVLTVLENTLLKSILGTALGGPMPILNKNIEPIYTSDYDSKQEAKEAGDDLNVRIAEEGFTLLLNENGALPIHTPQTKGENVSQRPKVSVFGKNSVDIVLGGTGSGSGSGEKAKTLYDGLEVGGFEVNPRLKSFYEGSSSGSGRSSSPKMTAGSDKAPTLDIGETPVNRYSANLRASFKDYNDAAIVVISRLGGESWDLPRSQNVENGGIAGNHYLQLDKNEYDMLDLVTSRFKKVIVLLNTLTSFQCNFIEEYNNSPEDPRIDAVMWIGGPGTTGMMAIGNLLNGNVSPSGRTVDIYAKDFTNDPTYFNFGDNSQVNGGENGSAFIQNNAAVPSQNFIAYDEGIYMGYRYYETRAHEAAADNSNPNWYRENVVFPFGYGLSYTQFTQEIVRTANNDNTGIYGNLETNGNGELTISVKVTNTGSVPGKDVVELYVNKPYTSGGIEKPYVVLLDYAKTKLLEPGEDDTVTFKFKAYDLASYDYNDANYNNFKGYELENGTYKFFISKNSHVEGAGNVYDSAEYVLNANNVYKGLTFRSDPDNNSAEAVVENRYTTDDFFDSQYRLATVSVVTEQEGPVERKGMSRSDFEGTNPAITLEDGTKTNRHNKQDRTVLENELAALNDKTPNNTKISEATVLPDTDKHLENIKDTVDGKEVMRSIILRDLLDEAGVADYDDERWEELLDRLTFNEMLNLVNNGAFRTAAIESIKKNLTNDSDGPVGFVNFINRNSYKGNNTFASEIVIGSTWNKDLAYQMGKIVGENGVWGDINVNHLPYSGWYAPAVNLHRSPFSGRNFEYYSEDPILSGKMAVNVINGARTKGVYTDLKHFALNDQETNRGGVATYCTEQALREMYLKPFEMAVKGNDNPDEVASAKADGITSFKGTLGIMSSFNRIGTRWTGGDYRLCTEILRNEWGFRGLVICDYKTDNSVMDSRQMLYAGNDLILASMPNLLWTDAKSDSAQDVTILRQATKNILYTVANSNSMNVDVVGYRLEWWISLTIALDVIIPAGLAVWGFFAIKGALKKAKREDDQTLQ